MNGGGSLAKEIAIRKRIKSIYNKSEQDFKGLREYNDYLEEVEDIIFNLVEGVDVAATDARVKAYEAENLEQILGTRAQKAQERSALARTKQQEESQSQDGGREPFVPSSIDFASMSQRPAAMMQPTPVRVEADAVQNLSPEEQAQRVLRGQQAGGWSDAIPRQKAFEEAFASLWTTVS